MNRIHLVIIGLLCHYTGLMMTQQVLCLESGDVKSGFRLLLCCCGGHHWQILAEGKVFALLEYWHGQGWIEDCRLLMDVMWRPSEHNRWLRVWCSGPGSHLPNCIFKNLHFMVLTQHNAKSSPRNLSQCPQNPRLCFDHLFDLMIITAKVILLQLFDELFGRIWNRFWVAYYLPDSVLKVEKWAWNLLPHELADFLPWPCTLLWMEMNRVFHKM